MNKAFSMASMMKRKKMSKGGEADDNYSTPAFRDHMNGAEGKNSESNDGYEERGMPALGAMEDKTTFNKSIGEVTPRNNKMDSSDMVDKVMRKRFSKGGQVANDTPIVAGFEENDFDDLALRDDLESSYGKDNNSGDESGNAQEDENRKDIVKRIMKQRSMKQRNPRPA